MLLCDIFTLSHCKIVTVGLSIWLSQCHTIGIIVHIIPLCILSYLLPPYCQLLYIDPACIRVSIQYSILLYSIVPYNNIADHTIQNILIQHSKISIFVINVLCWLVCTESSMLTGLYWLVCAVWSILNGLWWLICTNWSVLIGLYWLVWTDSH